MARLKVTITVASLVEQEEHSITLLIADEGDATEVFDRLKGAARQPLDVEETVAKIRQAGHAELPS